jgi:hypothetical protein
MAILKFKDNGEWKSIAAFKGEDGKDGAIQYKPGPGINISEDNIISATFSGEDGVDITVDAQPLPNSTNPVSSGGVYTALQDKADKSEIKTDTSELTNGAGFITGGDIPKDLGDFDNEAGFLKEETDPLFSRSVAASITDADKALWNRVGDLTFVPMHFDLNFNSATVNSMNYTYKTSAYLDKIIRLAGSLQKAIVCVTTAGHSVLLHYYQTANSSSQEMITDYYGLTPSDNYGRYATIRLRIIQSQKTGAHISTQFSSMGSSYNLVTKTKVLTKDNTSSFTPTADYHPATKKYVDDTVAAGVAGAGGIDVEEDPVFMSSVASSITEDDITRWNNKADSGGIDQETDPTVPAWVKSITEADIDSWNGKANISDIPEIVGGVVDGKGFLTEETEFNNSAAAKIKDSDIANWNNKQDRLFFNTAYDAENNKAATMADVSEVEAKIPTLTSQLKNDSGFLTSVNASVVVQDNNASFNSNQTRVDGLYSSLHNNAVVNGVVDYSKLVENFDLRTNDLNGTFNGLKSIYYSTAWGKVSAIQHVAEKEMYAYARIGTSGYYDTCISFEAVISFDMRDTYVGISSTKWRLYVNEEDIIAGVEGPYALESTTQSTKVARYS